MPSTAPARRRPADHRRRQREDHGFFGPGSVVWRLWGYPTSVTVGFQRSVAELRLVYAASPATADVVVPAFRGDPVKDPRVVTVAEARARWGKLPSPAEMERARRGELAST